MNDKKQCKPTRITDGFRIKKQLHGGFKIQEFFHFSNEGFIRKRTLFKNMNLSDAEDKLYRLENNK